MTPVVLWCVCGTVAIVSEKGPDGNMFYTAHMIQGRYQFARDIAYEPLTIEGAEEEMKSKKKRPRVRAACLLLRVC